MKRLVTAATLALAATALLSTAALTQRPAADPPRGKVLADYVLPPYQHIYENLKRRQVLEELGEFLSPLKLKRDLTLKTVQCGVVNAFYDPDDHSISMCYEMVAEFENSLGPFVEGKLVLNRTIKLKPRVQNVTRAEAIVGAFVGVLLHETGHAVFDIQQNSAPRPRGGQRRSDRCLHHGVVRQGRGAHDHQGHGRALGPVCAAG